ncbi:hypothetical protein [Streptomyces albidoflavus]|uniref:hypothetical protein n=1 Tax=Streptomyces albidoflavus TaxID=1886 RepID=UPI00188D6669|nr:hypothetical protein [Streptomyces albidoflavus]MBF4135077.1 hypothetical protein [Streptomyces albidoflavus]
MRQTPGFGRDRGIEWGQRPVPVLLIKLSKALGQGWLVAEPLVDAHSKLLRRQPAPPSIWRANARTTVSCPVRAVELTVSVDSTISRARQHTPGARNPS